MKINIRETLETIVEAESLAEAKEKYAKGEIELNPEDMKNVVFSVYEGDADGC